MEKTRGKYIKSESSRWIRILGSFCGIFTILFFLFYIVWVIYNGQFVDHILRCSILLSIVVLIIWSYSKTLFYSVTATERGLEAHNIVGIDKIILWEDIAEVKRPHLGIPVNFTYVISINKDRLYLIRNKNNYKELIQYIKNKAPDLKYCNP